VRYYDPSGAGTPAVTKTATVACNGTFSVSIKAATVLVGLSARTDKVTAIDTGNRSAGYTFKLNPLL